MKLPSQLKITLIFFVLLSCYGQAQNSLDLSSSLGISFRLAEKDTPGKRLNQGDDPAQAYRFGAAYSLKLGPRTYLSTGLSYASLASKRTFDPGDLRWGTQWNGTEFEPGLPSGEEVSATVKIDRTFFLEAPISIRRYPNENKRFYVHVGLTPAYHSRYMYIQKSGSDDRIAEENSRSDFQSFQLAARTGVGMDFPLTEKLNIFSQLSGQVHLLEEVKDSGLRWWDVSLQAGLRLGI